MDFLLFFYDAAHILPRIIGGLLATTVVLVLVAALMIIGERYSIKIAARFNWGDKGRFFFGLGILLCSFAGMMYCQNFAVVAALCVPFVISGGIIAKCKKPY